MVQAAQFLDLRGRTRDLLALRHERGAILERPPIILHIRDFDAASPEAQGQIDHRRDAFNVGAVYDDIDGEWKTKSNHLIGERILAREGALVPGNRICRIGAAVLDGDLYVVEACL